MRCSECSSTLNDRMRACVRALCALCAVSTCVRACSEVSDFLATWACVCDAQEAERKAMTQRDRSKVDCTPRARWTQSVRSLAEQAKGVDTNETAISAGFLIWRPHSSALCHAQGLLGVVQSSRAIKEEKDKDKEQDSRVGAGSSS